MGTGVTEISALIRKLKLEVSTKVGMLKTFLAASIARYNALQGNKDVLSLLYSRRQELIVKGAEVISLKNEHKLTRRRQVVSPVQMICQQKQCEGDKLTEDNVKKGGKSHR